MKRTWSTTDIALLRERFPHERTADVALALGRSYSTVAQKAAKLGIAKSAAYLASPAARRTDGKKGTATRFTPGTKPWNKGVPGSTGQHPNSRAHHFKPGEMRGMAQHNYVPVGTTRISKDGYLERKVNDTHPTPARRWVGEHRIVWEAEHGPIPAGHAVVFLPGRKTTDPALIHPDALELISRRELMARNSVHAKYPPELARVAQLRGAITRQINRRAKQETP